MADDRQLADIWRHQYTGPLFRKYAVLEQIPEASIGYLARQSRLAVDFCQTMMKPLGLKQYAVNTPINLPSGETGVMRTHVIAGFGGMPIVTTRVELSLKREDEEQATTIPPMFYFLRVDTNEQYQVNVEGGQWSISRYRCDLPRLEDGIYYYGYTKFWCGESDSDFILLHSDSWNFYSPGGNLLKANDYPRSWCGAGIVKVGNFIVGHDGGGTISSLNIYSSSNEPTVIANEETFSGYLTFNTKGDAGVGISDDKKIGRVTLTKSTNSVEASISVEAAEEVDTDSYEETREGSDEYVQSIDYTYKTLDECPDQWPTEETMTIPVKRVTGYPAFSSKITSKSEKNKEKFVAIAFSGNDEKYLKSINKVIESDLSISDVQAHSVTEELFVDCFKYGLGVKAAWYQDGTIVQYTGERYTEIYNADYDDTEGYATEDNEFVGRYVHTWRQTTVYQYTPTLTTYGVCGNILFGVDPFCYVISDTGPSVRSHGCTRLDTWKDTTNTLLASLLQIDLFIVLEGEDVYSYSGECSELKPNSSKNDRSIVIIVNGQSFDTGIVCQYIYGEAEIENFAYNADKSAILLIKFSYYEPGDTTYENIITDRRLYGLYDGQLTDITSLVGQESLTTDDGDPNLIDLCPLRPRNQWTS